MIIYCAGPIRGDIKYQKYYKEIVDFLSGLQHTALSELHPNFKSSIPLTDGQIFERDMKWLSRSKFVIAEISGPSLGVGFEIAYTVYHLKKPVLALAHRDVSSISAMINGCDSGYLTVERYSDSESLKKIVQKFLNKMEAAS